VFDTGSALLWVASSSCVDCEFGQTLDCTLAISCYQSYVPFPLAYGAGSAEGYLAYAPVSFGGNFSSPNQTFDVVVDVEDFGGMQADGILGLGFASLANGIPTVIDNLKTQGIIPARVFSFFISNDPTGWGAGNSELIIGGYDPQYFGNSEQYFINIPVVDPNYWAVALNSFKVGNSSFLFTPKKALIDSGTSLLTMTNGDFENFFDALSDYDPACNSITSTCGCDDDNIGNYPVLYFELGNHTFSLQPQYYLLYAQSSCQVLVGQLGYATEINMWIMGDVFMRQYYTLFNIDNMTIGFAVSAATVIPPNHTWVIVGIILAILASFVLLYSAFRWYKQRRLQQFSGSGRVIGGVDATPFNYSMRGQQQPVYQSRPSPQSVGLN